MSCCVAELSWHRVNMLLTFLESRGALGTRRGAAAAASGSCPLGEPDTPGPWWKPHRTQSSRRHALCSGHHRQRGVRCSLCAGPGDNRLFNRGGAGLCSHEGHPSCLPIQGITVVLARAIHDTHPLVLAGGGCVADPAQRAPPCQRGNTPH